MLPQRAYDFSGIGVVCSDTCAVRAPMMTVIVTVVTLVAITTSLPELMASLAAVRLGAIDLAIGNAFGSNAFNMILFVPLDAAYPGNFFQAVSPAHAVTAFAVIVATAIEVLGQLYHVERRLPVVEPDALLMILVICGALVLVFRLSS